ncbi:MAG TPA: DUF2158 domain-containing protein [Chloroflexota bacterium]|nr:DUF2158 domain-containing protein [Chloroflexota bacterium]
MAVLKSGDLVVLKSGGPVMTVDTVNTDIFDDDKVTGILCAWFVGDKLERARFDHAALITAPSQGSVSERTEFISQEVTGEYIAVLDEMVAAMNDAPDAPRLPAILNGVAAEKPKRAPFAKADAGAAGPQVKMQMD